MGMVSDFFFGPARGQLEIQSGPRDRVRASVNAHRDAIRSSDATVRRAAIAEVIGAGRVSGLSDEVAREAIHRSVHRPRDRWTGTLVRMFPEDWDAAVKLAGKQGPRASIDLRAIQPHEYAAARAHLTG